MAGNKHKNGIVCMFPGCERKMRTQKFKGHFVKLHLREGEEYTVEHRRQYEIAQADPPSDSDAIGSASALLDTMGAALKTKSEVVTGVKRPPSDIAKRGADAPVAGATPSPHGQTGVTDQAARQGESNDEQRSTGTPHALTPSTARPKRGAAAISPDTTLAAAANGHGLVDDSTMVKILMLMDRRFNELTNRMDEVVEMQRLLFTALASSESAAEAEHAAKKRKDTSTTIV